MAVPRAGEDVGAKLQALLHKHEEVEKQLQSVELQIYNLETAYLEDTMASGNVVKGWDSYLSSRKQAYSQFKYKMVKPQDRIFSSSSVTSDTARQAAQEAEAKATKKYKQPQAPGSYKKVRKIISDESDTS